jgi:hypothetical protein
MATSWFKRLRQWEARPAGRRRPARARLGIEALEVREVPTVHAFVDTAGVLQVSTDNSDDVTINHIVTQSGPVATVTNANNPANQFAFHDFQYSSIHIQGGFDKVNILATVKPLTADDNSFITVGSVNTGTKTGTLQNIRAPLSLGTAVPVQLDDSADPTGRNVTLNVVNNVVQVTNMAPAPISVAVQEGPFNGDVLRLFQLFGGRGHNTFNVLDTPAAFLFFTNQTETDIFTGASGDQVFVRGTHSADLEVNGGGRDLVTIGNNGNLDNIQSPVFISNPHNFSGLIVDGSAARSAQNVTLSVANGLGTIHGTIHGLAPQDITYLVREVSEVIVRGSAHRNTWTVFDTFANPTFNGTVIETGAGGDTVNVLGTTGRLDVIGAGGFDTVNVGGDSSALRTLTHIHGQVNVLNFGGPRTQLHVNASGDNFRHSVTLDATAS